MERLLYLKLNRAPNSAAPASLGLLVKRTELKGLSFVASVPQSAARRSVRGGTGPLMDPRGFVQEPEQQGCRLAGGAVTPTASSERLQLSCWVKTLLQLVVESRIFPFVVLFVQELVLCVNLTSVQSFALHLIIGIAASVHHRPSPDFQTLQGRF